MIRDRVDRVRDGEDPRAERDLLPCEPVRIALTVPALVMRANDLDAGIVQEGDAADHLRPEEGVRLHHPPLGLVQLDRLEQDLVGHADLADVVEKEAVLERGVGRELGIDCARQLERVALHALRMLPRPRVLRPERARERRHRLLVRALEQPALRPLDLDEMAEIAGVEDELLLV